MLVSACGVRPTGVLEAGPAPTVGSNEVTFYLLTSDGLPVRRTRVVTGSRSAAASLQQLLAGPTDQDRKDGLTSEVPVTTAEVSLRGGVVSLPLDPSSLSSLAYLQISCTAASSGLQVLGMKPGMDCG